MACANNPTHQPALDNKRLHCTYFVLISTFSNMSVTKALFSLNQKIFVVQAFYKHNENWTRVRMEFHKKYNILTTDTIFRSFNTILKFFSTTGAVTQVIQFDVLESLPSKVRRPPEWQPKQEVEEDGNAQDTTVMVADVVYHVDEGDQDVIEEIVDVPSSEDQSLAEELEETQRAAESILEDGARPSIHYLKDSPTANYSLGRAISGRPATAAVAGYACPHCPKLLQSNAGLITHIRTHTNERPFNCSSCQKSFKQKGALKIHTRIHTGEKPYYCAICSKGFRQNINLQCHLRNSHGQTLNELRKKRAHREW